MALRALATFALHSNCGPSVSQGCMRYTRKSDQRLDDIVETSSKDFISSRRSSLPSAPVA